MGLLDEVKDALAGYASGGKSAEDLSARFHQVVDSADSRTLSAGVAEALRSDQTPPFAQMVGQLFANGTTEQKAAMLNALVAAAPPEIRERLAGLIPGGASAAPISGAQATGLSSDVVNSVARQVEQHDPGVIERMGSFYAQHPTLVKTLGATAMMVAMRKIAERQQA